MGRSDAAAAVAAAAREGFPTGALIFLDQEEGGRLLPEQLSYVLGWVDAVRREGWQGGVYCSGIPVDDGNGGTITTAQDIERQAGSWKIPLWVARDECRRRRAARSRASRGCSRPLGTAGCGGVAIRVVAATAGVYRRMSEELCEDNHAMRPGCTTAVWICDLDTANVGRSLGRPSEGFFLQV